ncbi:MAG: alpha-L-rhamnosidase C-terminal domain-containing protein, partial [Bacteroidota bacterium]
LPDAIAASTPRVLVLDYANPEYARKQPERWKQALGNVPFVVPNVLPPWGGSMAGGSTGWADASTIVPWNTYLAYGDTRLLENQYESMKAWVGYMEKQAGDDYLWDTGFHFGDWLFYSVNDDRDGASAITDKYFLTQAFFAHSTDLVRRTAEVLGKKEDAARYAALLEKVKAAFQKEHVTASGRLSSATQTAYVLALAFDLLPENLRQQAADRLVENIRRYNSHLTTGFLGTPHINHVLTHFGYPEVAYELLLQETYPSWLYPVKMGATTIWERWDGIKPDSTFQEKSMNSFNHYAYGAIGDWLYRTVAGIELDEAQPGYKHFFLQPQPGGGLTSAKAWHLSPLGKIESDWAIEGGKLRLRVVVPANATATVRLPKAAVGQVTEGGKALGQGNGVRSFRQVGEGVEIEIGSGEFVFVKN